MCPGGVLPIRRPKCHRRNYASVAYRAVAKRRNYPVASDPARTPLVCPKCQKKWLRQRIDPEHQRVVLTCRPNCGYRRPFRFETFLDGAAPRSDLQDLIG